MDEERFNELRDEFDRIVEDGERIAPPERLEEDA